jgi:hypothetical protein
VKVATEGCANRAAERLALRVGAIDVLLEFGPRPRVVADLIEVRPDRGAVELIARMRWFA